MSKRLYDIPFVRSAQDILNARFWKRIPNHIVAGRNKKKSKINKMKRRGIKTNDKWRLNSIRMLTKEKIHAEESLKWVGLQLKDTLLQNLSAFPSPSAFHPLDRQIIDLTDFDENYNYRYLQRIKNARKLAQQIDDIIKHKIDYEINNAVTPNQANRIFEDGKVELRNLLRSPSGRFSADVDSHKSNRQDNNRGVNLWDDLCSMAICLRGLPVFDLEMPTISLVGSPNVGKSSLVRALSSGKPEVNHYPFTTRGILIGHLDYGGIENSDVCDDIGFGTNSDNASQVEKGHIVQVIDTPGILYRSDEERNNIEKLTFAVLDHSPSAIGFVMDFSESGLLLEDQVNMRNEMKEKYCNANSNDKRLWVDIVSKFDITSQNLVNRVKSNMLVDCDEIFLTSAVEPYGIDHLRRKLFQER